MSSELQSRSQTVWPWLSLWNVSGETHSHLALLTGSQVSSCLTLHAGKFVDKPGTWAEAPGRGAAGSRVRRLLCFKEELWTPKSWPAAKGTRHAGGGSLGSCCKPMGLPSVACHACQVKPPRPVGLSSFHGGPPGTGSRREPWCGYGLLPWRAARWLRNRTGGRRAAVGGLAQLGPPVSQRPLSSALPAPGVKWTSSAPGEHLQLS